MSLGGGSRRFHCIPFKEEEQSIMYGGGGDGDDDGDHGGGPRKLPLHFQSQS